MKKINNLLLALLSVFALAWTACDDEVEYTPAGLLDGNGVYFPTSTQTSYEVEGTSGTLTFDVMRTLTTEAQEATLNITYGEGAESVFSIPANISCTELSAIMAGSVSSCEKAFFFVRSP